MHLLLRLSVLLVFLKDCGEMELMLQIVLEQYDVFLKLLFIEESILYSIIELVPLQILTYYLALIKNVDPDYPRNLAKSVTVK